MKPIRDAEFFEPPVLSHEPRDRFRSPQERINRRQMWRDLIRWFRFDRAETWATLAVLAGAGFYAFCMWGI